MGHYSSVMPMFGPVKLTWERSQCNYFQSVLAISSHQNSHHKAEIVGISYKKLIYTMSADEATLLSCSFGHSHPGF